MLKVTDTITGQTTTIERRSDLPDAIREWFPAEWNLNIEESAHATDEFLLNYLGVKVEVI